MTSTARDLRYGRRGGRWLDQAPGEALAATKAHHAAQVAAGAHPADHAHDTRPATIARQRAHTDPGRRRGTCPADRTGKGKRADVGPCTCTPAPDDLDAVWAGRARMAWARHDARQPLDDIDEQAIARHPRAQ